MSAITKIRVLLAAQIAGFFLIGSLAIRHNAETLLIAAMIWTYLVGRASAKIGCPNCSTRLYKAWGRYRFPLSIYLPSRNRCPRCGYQLNGATR